MLCVEVVVAVVEAVIVVVNDGQVCHAQPGSGHKVTGGRGRPLDVVVVLADGEAGAGQVVDAVGVGGVVVPQTIAMVVSATGAKFVMTWQS